MAYDYTGWLYGKYDQALCTGLIDPNLKHMEKGSSGWEIVSIPRCFATPNRAFANMASVLTKFYGREVSVENIPLPFISISRETAVIDPSRMTISPVRHAALQYYGSFITDETSADDLINAADLSLRVVQVKHPVPIKITYQLDFWCKQHRHKDYLDVAWHRMFRNNIAYITVEFDEPFGSKLVSVLPGGLTDNSELEGNEEFNRTLRMSGTMEVQGWIPDSVPSALVPLIRQIVTDYIESSDLESEDDLLVQKVVDNTETS